VPAAAVIPAPIVYINVAAVKKLVVEFLLVVCASGPRLHSIRAGRLNSSALSRMRVLL
jgi:hypothetical protein